MTDDEFNAYLQEQTLRTIGLMTRYDCRVEIRDGAVLIVSADGERMIPVTPREGQAIAFGVAAAYSEIEQRDFLRRQRRR